MTSKIQGDFEVDVGTDTSVFGFGDITIARNIDLKGGTANIATITTTPTAARTITLQDATHTVVGLDTTDTLTNKTITGSTNTVSADSLKTTGSDVDVVSAAPPSVGQVLTATSATTATWQAAPSASGESNTGSNIGIAGVGVFDGKVGVDLQFRNINTADSNLITVTDDSGNNEIDIDLGPNALTTTSSHTSITNKNFSDSTTFIVDNGDATLRIGFDAAGTTGTTTTLTSSQTVNRIITLPDAADTLVGKATTDTMTNKTITGSTNTVSADNLKTTGSDVDVVSAAPPSSGQVLTATSSTTATWQTPSSTVFGSAFQFAESAGRSTTTSTTFIEKLKLTTASLTAGDYVIQWYYVWDFNNTSNDFLGRVQIDDTTTIHSHRQEPKDPNGGSVIQEHSVSGFHVQTLTAAVHEIDIDFATSNAPNTAAIKEARLMIYRQS